MARTTEFGAPAAGPVHLLLGPVVHMGSERILADGIQAVYHTLSNSQRDLLYISHSTYNSVVPLETLQWPFADRIRSTRTSERWNQIYHFLDLFSDAKNDLRLSYESSMTRFETVRERQTFPHAGFYLQETIGRWDPR